MCVSRGEFRAVLEWGIRMGKVGKGLGAAAA